MLISHLLLKSIDTQGQTGLHTPTIIFTSLILDSIHAKYSQRVTLGSL